MRIIEKSSRLLPWLSLSTIFILGLLCFSGPAYAEDERSQSSLKEESLGASIDYAKESKAISYDAERPEDLLSLRYGGKFNISYKYYKNIDNEKNTEDFLKWTLAEDLFVWADLNYAKTHRVYAKIYDSYITRKTGETYTGIGADNGGPWLSLGFYELNLSELGVPLRLTTGRQYFFLGTGVAYSAVHDGIQAEIFQKPFYFKTFAAKTQPRQDNIDFSVPGFEKEGDRVFAGTELSYLGFSNTSLYGFGLIQKDNSSSNPDTPSQIYHYNSRYAGAGIASSPVKGLDTWAEFIYEGGAGFTDASRTALAKTHVKAYAYQLGAKFSPDLPTNPAIRSSYAYGSGDEDRTSVTNTVGGDLDGHDKNFLYFGYYQTGYALQPRLSNLKLWEIDGSFSPLESVPLFKKMALGAKYYIYWKDKTNGGTSDFQSTSDDGAIGNEWNLFMSWRIFQDVTLDLKYGVFSPGEAFPEDSRANTHFFSSTVALTF